MTLNTVMNAMTGIELINHLRLVASYHMGTDLCDRLALAERVQRQQREALQHAADMIEQLEQELRQTRAETPPTPRKDG